MQLDALSTMLQPQDTSGGLQAARLGLQKFNSPVTWYMSLSRLAAD